MQIRSVLLAFSLLLAFFIHGCGSGNSGTNGARQISWSASDDRNGQSAMFHVPMDALSEEGPQISLALRRYPAIGQKKGSIVVNPGGPGASGVEYLDYFAGSEMGLMLREDFDLVAFDPRGVGGSTNVRCVDDPMPYVAIDRAPRDEREYQDMIATVQAYTARCAENGGELLEHLSTMDVVRDLELIRRAMGEGRLNYIGFSYGTKIGALYADAYPLNVRAMVLDGVYPASLSLLDLTLEQTAGFERSLQAFLMSCMQNSACPFGGGNPQEALAALMARLKQQPIPAGTDRSLGYGEAAYGVLMGLYAQEFWPFLERALAAAQAGDGRQLLALTDAYFMRSEQGVYPNAIDAFYAVTCTDSSPLNAAQVGEQIDAATRAYPFFGAMFINDMLYCTYWPAAPGLQPRTVSATGAPPIMVVGTTGDPATPYAWSQRLTNELNSSFLVTLEAQRHVAAGTDRCVDDRYRQYLRQPEAGFGDLLCGQDGSRGDD